MRWNVTLPSGHIRREFTRLRLNLALRSKVCPFIHVPEIPSTVRQFDWGIDVDRISVYFVTSLAASVQPAFRSK